MSTLFANDSWPTLGRPNAITLDRFTELLKSKASPAVSESSDIYQVFQAGNLDVSFALAQFRVESQYATAGYAAITKSWGNMLYDSTLTAHASGQYSPGNGYTYAKYDTFLDSAKDYVTYLHDYAERRKLVSIFDATAEWIGKDPSDDYHLYYVDVIIHDMARYEWKTQSFIELGDIMIDARNCFDNSGKILTRYPLKKGTNLYQGTSGKLFTTYDGPDTTVWFLGLANNSTAWGLIKVTSGGSPKYVYLKNIDLTQIQV